MNGKNTLDAHTVGDLANRDRGADTRILHCNHSALKDLNTGLCALFDSHMNTNGVAGVDVLLVFSSQEFFFDFSKV